MKSKMTLLPPIPSPGIITPYGIMLLFRNGGTAGGFSNINIGTARRTSLTPLSITSYDANGEKVFELEPAYRKDLLAWIALAPQDSPIRP